MSTNIETPLLLTETLRTAGLPEERLEAAANHIMDVLQIPCERFSSKLRICTYESYWDDGAYFRSYGLFDVSGTKPEPIHVLSAGEPNDNACCVDIIVQIDNNRYHLDIEGE